MLNNIFGNKIEIRKKTEFEKMNKDFILLVVARAEANMLLT